MSRPGEPNASKNAWRAIKAGLRGRCPRCEKGDLFAGFLRQVEHCPVCGEHLGRYNVGLLLPFIVITIVAHVIIFVMLDMELNRRASPLIYLSVLVPMSIVVPLLIIRPAKGGLIGFLWARGLSDELDR
ncbi:DUF983 domain-containing protein [Devosia sp. ZB163]|uniref:DUF983 domain-containing protein n=1 Tax=Devosia sp. ZB163 TaxID=3025938 RepID=UPI00235DF644|nr:DUF983 domain-containing protein [Devosia sp. ZB163]MDC9822644.1 DUF983 domain-containing protein [Devosia sp. ZB163]